MGYRFKRHKTPSDEVRRVALEQVARAIADVSEPALNAETRIHSLRKRFKKLRALLRLVRGVDPKFSVREGNRFRRLGRKLSDLRDRDVLLKTLSSVSGEKSARPKAKRDIERLRRSLDVGEDGSRTSPRGTDPLRTIELQLQESKEAFLCWQPTTFEFDDLLDEFIRAYGRGRRSLQRASADPTSEKMHDLRKRTKDYGYQLALFRDFWDGSAKSPLAQAEKAGLLLGREHDLALLAERVDEKLRDSSRKPDLKRLRRRIAHSRSDLDQECLKLCGKLYRRKRRRLRRKLSSAATASKATR